MIGVLDTALEAKVLANKDESKCFKPLIAVIRPVRDRYSFLNSYYHKLSENVWVRGYGAPRSEISTGVTMAGQPTEQPNNQTRKDRATQPMDHGRLR